MLLTFAIIPNQQKYNKPIIFLFGFIGGLMILTTLLTSDVVIIVFLESSFLAILVSYLAIIIGRSFSDITNSEIKKIESKVDLIIEKLNTTPVQVSVQPSPKIELEQLPHIIEEWKIVIKTQMHFNDLLIKVRTATLTVALAVFGAAGYSILSKDTIPLTIDQISWTFHPSIFIISSGIIILISMFMIDYKYYFPMLKGAVKRGYEFDLEFQQLEQKFGRKYFGISSTIRDAIGKPEKSKLYVKLFYIIPIITGILFLLAIIIGYHPTN